MQTRIQFRIEENTKRLAQQMTESQGRTLSDACRELISQLAEQQENKVSHDQWLSEQVHAAFEKLQAEQSVFLPHDDAKLSMESIKAKIRSNTNK